MTPSTNESSDKAVDGGEKAPESGDLAAPFVGN
jgi:hypothetical protein